jgi:hypothetical protein
MPWYDTEPRPRWLPERAGRWVDADGEPGPWVYRRRGRPPLWIVRVLARFVLGWTWEGADKPGPL